MAGTVLCPTDLLRPTLVNLVGKAIKFTQGGRVSVRVSSPDRETLRFSVTDDGNGFAPDRLERILDPYVQADSSTTRKYGGTGLGLTICKHLVEQMGGAIHATSEPGGGSEFSFVIPALAQDRADAAPPGRPLPTDCPIGSAPPLRGHVLIVEDHSVNQLVARRMLERLGCTVSNANDGQLAIRAALDTDIDLIWMDYHMPVLDGIEAARILRRDHHCELPIIAMTADAAETHREACAEVGMNEFLAKPITMAEMRATLTPWLATTK